MSKGPARILPISKAKFGEDMDEQSPPLIFGLKRVKQTKVLFSTRTFNLLTFPVIFAKHRYSLDPTTRPLLLWSRGRKDVGGPFCCKTAKYSRCSASQIGPC